MLPHASTGARAPIQDAPPPPSKSARRWVPGATAPSQPAAPARPSTKQWFKKKRTWAAAFVGLVALNAVFADQPSEEEVIAADPAVTTTQGQEDETTATTTTATETTTSTSTTAAIGDLSAHAVAITVSDPEISAARAQLARGEIVEAFGDTPEYERDSYTGGGWPDSDGDCQSDRHEILIQESLVEPVLDADGCRVETGLWVDLYDGTEYTIADLVTIDHFIPLSAAHSAGAWGWDEESRRAFAVDIEFAATHAAVGEDNNQAKGNSGPEDWRPPSEAAWCRYAVDWISVKDRWSLAFRTAEVEALTEMLETCQPVAAINALAGNATAPEVAPTTTAVRTSTTTSSTTTTATPTTTTTVPPTSAAPTTAPPATAAPDCHPNYDPCIPNLPGDALNCPQVGRQVRVIGGSDPYRLDGDNDGLGCES